MNSVTETDQVWQAAYANQQQLIGAYHEHIHPWYIQGFQRLSLSPHELPDKAALDAALRPFGWEVVLVDGIIHSREFAALIAEQRFPVAANVRTLSQLEHSPAPDAIHDILGHLPFLCSPAYCAYLRNAALAFARCPLDRIELEYFSARKTYGDLTAASASADQIAQAEHEVARLSRMLAGADSLIAQVNRLFLWSIEFGVLQTPEQRIMLSGAAILSSRREVTRVLREQHRYVPYTSAAAQVDINYTEPQSIYFVAPSFDSYQSVLEQVMQPEQVAA
ncbi:hypothetical protein V8J88_19905 [Massilia sp. W12]|uniref:hypothetical protein n=1 Tax=Massilia sp. W12 TaxID=3126507 RepID=UPI0030D15C23